MHTIDEIVARCSELQTELTNATEQRTAEIQAEIAALHGEMTAIKERAAAAEKARKQLDEMLRSGAPAAEVRDITGNDLKTEKGFTGPDAEYRSAFMKYVQTGEMSPILKRADAAGSSSNLGVMIPNTVQQEIITEIEKVTGTLYSKVKHTNVPGGVDYPIGEFSATFRRITETSTSDRQNPGGITGKISFKYYIGEIRLARTLLQTVLTVPAFEAKLAEVIAKAYLKGMDNEILNGVQTNNEMEGILTKAAATGSKIKVIEFTADEMADWKSIFTKVESELPLSMLNANYEYVMSNGTFMSNYMTLADDNNNPVAKFVSDGTTSRSIAGRPVTLVEPELMPAFNTAAAGKVFAMLWIPDEAYVINSNMEFKVDTYEDKDNNQFVTRALVINDGKVLREDMIILFKKKVVTPPAGGQG